MNRELWFKKQFKFELDNKDLHLLLERLNDTPFRLKQLVENIPENILIEKPNGKWSIKENIGHLTDLEELHDQRINDFIDGRRILRASDLQNKKTHQANHNSKNMQDLLNEFSEVRKKFIKRIESLDSETMEKIALHPRLNQPMRVIDLAQFVAEHDDHHIQTINELINKLN